MDALTFKLVSVPLLLVLAVVTLVAIARHKVAPRPGLLWVAVWFAAAFSISFPSIVVRVARLLGIGRGTDLVLYIFILFVLFALFIVHLRFRRLDEQITKIVRHLAISDASEALTSPPLEERPAGDRRGEEPLRPSSPRP